MVGSDIGPDTSRTTGAAVRFEELTKYYGEVAAVEDISLSVKAGEFLTLLGPSGSGKTSTLMMLAGFETPSAGEVFVGEEPMRHRPAFKRNIGMVFQNYALFPNMTVAQNIAFPLKMRKQSAATIQTKTNRILRLVKLEGMQYRRPQQLSGGQQQRVALARALVFNPPVLLMDEPLGALDKKLREHMQLEIKRIQQELGITVIYVTHDQEEALTMSDRIAVMNRGRIEQVDPADRLYENPVNRFVANFIGESNFFDGTVQTSAPDGCWVRCEDDIVVKVPFQENLRVGAKVHLALRPEKLAFVDGDDQRYGNVMSGQVENLLYIGEVTKYRIRLTAQTTVVLKQQNRLGSKRHLPEDKVTVGWSGRDTKLVVQ